MAFGICVKRGQLALVAGLVLAVFLGFSGEVSARPRLSSLVVDGNTGKVLFSRHPDARRYPASLTKIMTLYILFEEMKKRRINKHTLMRFSRHAAAQQPSKLGLRPGSRIRVIHAIKALVTKSANDVAVVVAEHISGSESRFARRMTRTARKLGMSRTTFRNASGLPDRRQVTTARDMVKLSRAIQRDFPEYFPYFKIRSFVYKGHKYRNHNRLLGRYRGMEGIKTGYTRAAGFNLTTSVKYNNRHIVAAVLGGKTGRARDAYMRYILDRSLPRAARFTPAMARARKLRLARAKAKSNSDRHVIKLLRRNAETPLEDRLLDAKIAAIVDKPVVLSSVVQTASITDTGKALGQGSREPLSPRAALSTRKPEHPPVATANTSPWNIQVGAYAFKEQAINRLAAVKRAAAWILKGRSGFAMEVNKGEKTFYRARFGLDNKRVASLACKNLKRKSIPCIVLQN